MNRTEPLSGTALYEAAESFIRQCYTELEKEDEIESRLSEIEDEIRAHDHYEHTFEEIEHGARMAWRNSPRCVGRLFWETLVVRDRRDVDDAAGVHQECNRHLEEARNGGKIQPTITIFPPAVRGEDQVRIWNHQLLRFAGYETDDGFVGDPAQVELTNYCLERGWEPPRTEFDFLPHVIQIGDRDPKLFEVPESATGRVPITHPKYEWFADLDLQWYDVPAVSDMCLEIGGIQYPAAPFNGWYLATEIGARNFADEDRYDMLAPVAERLGIDTSEPESLWRDEAVVALTRAVHHSFDAEGVMIVDHHTVTEQFEAFERREKAAGRTVYGDWTWLIPPVSPATTPIWKNKYEMKMVDPNFYYQESPLEGETPPEIVSMMSTDT